MNARIENEPSEPSWVGVVKSQVESIRFGTVQVVVHEARVVQIEKIEKVRFENPERSAWAVPAGRAQSA